MLHDLLFITQHFHLYAFIQVHNILWFCWLQVEIGICFEIQGLKKSDCIPSVLATAKVANKTFLVHIFKCDLQAAFKYVSNTRVLLSVAAAVGYDACV